MYFENHFSLEWIMFLIAQEIGAFAMHLGRGQERRQPVNHDLGRQPGSVVARTGSGTLMGPGGEI